MPLGPQALARGRFWAGVCAAWLLAPALWTQDAPATLDLRASQAWARATTSDAVSGAVYLTLENPDDHSRVLLSASCPRCDHCELHQHLCDRQGVMHMRQVSALTLPPHGTLVLQPGGVHVMLIGLSRGLSQGETITLTLRGDGGEVTLQVPVLAAAAMGPTP